MMFQVSSAFLPRKLAVTGCVIIEQNSIRYDTKVAKEFHGNGIKKQTEHGVFLYLRIVLFNFSILLVTIIINCSSTLRVSIYTGL